MSDERSDSVHRHHRDVKLLDLIEHALRPTTPPKLSNPEIVEVASNFIQNLQRMTWMLLTPSFVGDMASIVQRCEDIAEFQIKGKIEPAILVDPYPETTEIGNLASSLFKTYSQRYRGLPITAEMQKEVLESVFRGTRPLAMLLAPSAPARKGIEAMFAFTITGTWTAFEAMAGDSWEAALNIHPGGLAELKGRRKNKQPQDDQWESERESNKDVPLALIVRHQFDIGKKMGTVLRERQRMDSLSGIREAYRLAFFKKSEHVDVALDDAGIDAVAAVRNLIIHRAGVVDSTYERYSKYLDIPKTMIGQPLILDGATVAKLRQGVIAPSLALLSAVDTWITGER